MRILIGKGGAPVAGQVFMFGVEHTHEDASPYAAIRVGWQIEGLALDGDIECPNPPCHEMSFFVDAAAQDQTLFLTATSAGAESITATFMVGRPTPRPRFLRA